MSRRTHPGRSGHDARPLVVTWETTRACGLRCVHCRAEAIPSRHPGELTTEEGRALIDRVAAFGPPVPIFVFSGGDPLERPDLFELIRHGVARGLRVGVTPAPTARLDATAVRALREAGVHRMALSLDGAIPSRHDGFRGEPGSFDAILCAAATARAVGLPIQINTTVARCTASDLPRIADRVEALDAVMWEVFFLVPIGRGEALEPLSAAETELVLGWLYRRQREAAFRLITVEAPAYRRVGRQIESAERRAGASWDSNGSPAGSSHRRCAPHGSTGDGNGFLFVSHLGEVFPSGFLPLAAGNVRTDDLVDLYRDSALFRRLRDRDLLRGKCGRCEYRFACGGSRARAYAVTGDPMAEDPFCAYEPPRLA